MDFSFDLNHLVGSNDVFVVDKSLKPTKQADRVISSHKQLCEVIDTLGVASARAQGLPAVITTSSKLAYTDQRVYLYTDIEGNSGQGAAVGFIKVGTKKLFLYDHHGAQKETQPLCILDFYVHESRQRKGHGKKLYEYMLEHEGVTPSHLAIDKPSDKFLGFLAKHYKLRATIPQVNNYVVFDGFFHNRKDATQKRSSRFKRSSPTELACNPMSAAANRSALQTRSIEDHTRHYQTTHTNPGSRSPAEELAALSDIPLARPSSREKLVHSRHSPVTNTSQPVYSRGDNVQIPAHHASQPTRADLQDHTVENLPEEVTQLAVSNGGRSQSAQNTAYSRHTTSSTALPHQYSTSNKTDYKEPLRARYGQPGVVSTVDNLNTHQHVQDKQGHLKVTANKRGHHIHPTERQMLQQDAGDWSKTFHSSAGRTKQPESSWNVFGVPSGYSHISNRK